MSEQDEISEFLTTRRARLSLEQAGLPDFGGRRRVPGLRREEVALLAGVSPQYYTRFERGIAIGVSDAVLDSISRALQLDDAEYHHLRDLVHAATTVHRPDRSAARSTQSSVTAALQRTLDAMTEAPAIVQNGRLDLLATNHLARALFSVMIESRQRPVNFARFMFLDPSATDFYRHWDDTARTTVALLRAEAGRAPHDRALNELVGALSVGSDRFRTLWAAHDVREHRSGVKKVHHPIVGDLDLHYTALNIGADPGLQLLSYTAEPGSASAESLHILNSWAENTSRRRQSTAIQ